MDTTILVAKMLGIYLFLSGFVLLLRGRMLSHLLQDFFGHPATVYLTGVILIALSSMYLLQYNIWDGSWKVIITIFVWLILLKGVIYLFAPKTFSKMNVEKYRGFYGFYGVLAIAIGVYLFFLG